MRPSAKVLPLSSSHQQSNLVLPIIECGWNRKVPGTLKGTRPGSSCMDVTSFSLRATRYIRWPLASLIFLPDLLYSWPSSKQANIRQATLCAIARFMQNNYCLSSSICLPKQFWLSSLLSLPFSSGCSNSSICICAVAYQRYAFTIQDESR